MQKLTFINANNESIVLTSAPFGITEWEGFSNVDMDVQSQQVPFVDGSVYIDNLLGSRELSVTLAIEDNGDLKRRYELRREVIRMLNPKLGEGYLVYKNNHLEKQIRCVAHTPTFETHNSNTEGTPKAQLTFTASEPYWEDISSTLVNFSLSEQPTVINEGDVETQVKLKISGQWTNVRITNVTSKSQIGLTGTMTEPVEISTEFGNKTIVGAVMGWSSIFGGYLYGSASKSDTVVVVGTDGAILLSTDGLEWKSQFSHTVKNLYAVASSFNFNLFVAVGSDGEIIYSEDGKSWTVGTNAVEKDLRSIACSSSRFIAVGEEGTIVASSDGMNFTAVTSPVSLNLYSVIYDGTGFYAVGAGGTIISSEDGLSWSLVSSGVTYGLNGIAYNEDTGVYVAVGNEGTIITSPNGYEWSQIPVLVYRKLNSVAYNPNLGAFFIVGDRGMLITGSDTFSIVATEETTDFSNVAYVKDLSLMFIAGEGILLRLANEEGLEKCLSIKDSQLHDIMYIESEGLYVASGTDGNMTVSHDGENWESISLHTNVNIFSMAMNSDGTIIGVGTGGTIIRSTNGIDWSVILDGNMPYQYCLLVEPGSYLLIDTDGSKLITETSEGAGSLYGVVWNESIRKYVAVGDRGKIVTSSTGSIWELQASGTEAALRAIAEYNGLMIAVGDNGTMIQSTDGVYWEPVTSGTSYDLNAITTSPTKTRWVAGGSNGTIIKSIDGVKWKAARSGTSLKLNGICYSDSYSQFLAVGNEGTILSSVDGSEWKGHTSGTSQNYEDVIYSDVLGKYIAVGSRGTIMNSYISDTENLINMLSPNSDINFNLKVGENILRVSCESGNPAVTVEYKNKYVGV